MNQIARRLTARRWLPVWVLLMTGLLGFALQSGVFADGPEELYQQAVKLYAAKDYVGAQAVLEKLHKDFPDQATVDVSLKLADCYRHTIQASGKNEEWELAEGVLKDLIARQATSDLDRARAERLMANMKFEWPHWGYKTNAKFARGDNRGGGDYKDTFVEDRETALDAIRAARNDYEKALTAAALPIPDVKNYPLRPIESEVIDMYFDLGRIAAWENGNLYQMPPHAPADKNLPAEVTWQDMLSDKGLWTYATQRIVRLDHAEGRAASLRATYLHAMFLKRYYGLTAGNTIEKLNELPDAENPYKLLLETYRNAPVAAALKTPAAKQEDLAAECLYAAGMLMQDLQQYNTAIDSFKTLITERPESKWRVQAENAKKSDEQPVLSAAGMQNSQTLQDIDDTGKVTPRKITFPVQVRNVSEVKFTAQPVDLARAITSTGGNYYQLFNLYYNEDRNNKVESVLDYKVGEPLSFTCKVEDKGDHAIQTAQLEMPFDKPGAWVVEASIDGSKVRQVVVASDLMVVYRLTDGDPTIFVADAVSGKPATDATVTFYEQWWQNRQMQKELGSAEVSADGTVALPKNAVVNNRNLMVVAMRHDAATKAVTSIAFTQPTWMGRQNWNPGQQAKIFSVTDRPVYRPGQTVKFKHTVREYAKEEYTNPGAGMKLHVTINDVKGAKLYDQVLTTNDFGTVFGEMKLSETAALGQYWIQVFEENARWGSSVNGGNTFRVEEYKKPEYEVTVKADAEQVRMGGKVMATISAKYYYGAPVTQATVQYKVQRKRYNYTWSPDGEWSWLYGRYYGCCWYWPYWWYQQPVEDQELIVEGEAPIGVDGTFKVEIDTAPTAKKFPDADHEFEITATVRDASRRNIDGSGSVIVTRTPYYAVLSSDQGYWWWGAGEHNLSVRVQTQKPDSSPIASEGTVDVFRTEWNWQANNEKKEKIETKPFKVDATGSGLYTFNVDKPGQYEVVYTAKTDWGTDVVGSTKLWAYGEGFDGRNYKTNDLEIITDKRSYQPGETAKVMINAGHPGATVLVFNEVWWNVRSQKILTLDSKTTTIEIPITKADVPNFFLTAVTVRNGRVIQETREICVPPAEEFLDVKVQPDKPSYKPGEVMNLDITAKDKDGKPVAAEFDLSVFDKSILYIQPEYGSEIRTWFHGDRRQHWSNLQMSMQNMGWPQQWNAANTQYYGMSYPPAWQGDWGTAGEFGQGGLMLAEDDVAGDADVGASTAPGQAGGGRFGGMRYMQKGMVAEGAMARDGAMPPPTAAPAAPMAANAMAAGPGMGGGGGGGAPEPVFAAAVVRSNFADSAFWSPAVVTDKDGHASVKVPMPENLTGWVVNSHAITATTQVGKARVEVVTAKNLLVRLQTPRFAVQHDEVVISANVMNYLTKDKQAKVSLEINGKCATIDGDATRTVTVTASGEARVDWVVHIVKPGKIEMVCTALTDEESDAMKVDFPAVVYGMPVMFTQTKTMPYGEGDQNIDMAIPLPDKYDPDQSTLEVSYTPTLAGGMLEAMPYLVSYPYGCTEQTMSRYLPTVMVSDTLSKTGVDLDSVRNHGNRPAPEAIGRYGPFYYPYYYESPVFDKNEVNKMVEAGVERLYSFQHGDGGWGWWKDDKSSPYMTAYVCYGLQIGRNAHQSVDQAVLVRGYGYLNNLVNSLDLNAKVEAYDYEVRGPEGLAFMAVALAEGGQANEKLAQYLVANQDKMSDYGKALSVCALSHWNKKTEAKKAMDDLLTHVTTNKEFDTASLSDKHPDNYCYWYWYNNNIEANAWTLRALMAVQPDSELGPKMVRWLLSQRKGYRWNSTRDTAMCLFAMTDYLEKSKEAQCDYELTVANKGVKKTVAISAANMFNFDCRFVLQGEDVQGGAPDAQGHKSVEVAMTKKGKGAVYATMALQVYSQDEHIPAGGNQMSIVRTYYKLTPKTVIKKTRNAQGEAVDMPVLEYDRTELKAGDTVSSGDRIEVELTLNTPFEYEYIAIEDWKPAGCEPVDLTSDTQQGVDAWWTHRELRDQKVTFFVTWLNRGKATLTYQLRAETPGKFHVLPTKAYLMYTPEIQANSESFLMPINDTPVVKPPAK